MKIFTTGMTLVVLSLPALAEEESPWSGEGDIGFNKTSGNTETESLLAKLKVVYSKERWVHTAELGAINSSDDGARTAESYEGKWKSDYSYSDTYYAFASTRYEDNRFSGYEYQSTTALGVGAHLIASERTILDVEGGVGYRASEEQGTGETLDEGVLLGSLIYQFQLTDTTRFESDFNVEAGQDNTYLVSNLALKVKINAALALKLGYQVKHNTDVPVGTDKTDTLTSISLNYSF